MERVVGAFPNILSQGHPNSPRQFGLVDEAVACSHWAVLPEIIDEVAGATGTVIDARARRAGMLSTSEFTVLHVSIAHPESGLVTIETHGPALDWVEPCRFIERHPVS